MNAPEKIESSFVKLSKIDVSKHIEKKGQFSYLSWPWAISQLRQADPTAVWNVIRFDGMPYMKTELGYFVEVAVTVNGITLSQIHPVLDGRNRPIPIPTPYDINSSIQRCLVKAIALHGLGLNIYAGEDLPIIEDDEAAKKRIADTLAAYEQQASAGIKALESFHKSNYRTDTAFYGAFWNENGAKLKEAAAAADKSKEQQ